MRTILVLEDNPDRIAWLRSYLPRTRIIWVSRVQDLLAEQRRLQHVDLVILDHDLTTDESSNGTAAAVRLQIRTPFVIVWSTNAVRAPMMVTILERRSYRVGLFPFGTKSLETVLRKLS